MKKTILILAAMTLLLGACKKDDVIEASKVEMKDENVERGWDYIKISGEYGYPVVLESMTLYLSEKEDMSEAEAYSCVIEEKTFSVEADDLKDGTKYYYQYEYDNGYGKEKSERGDAVTIGKPVVITKDAGGVTTVSAVLSGEVTNNDAANKIEERGFCWGTEPQPTIAGNHHNNGGNTGIGTSTFSHNISNLQNNATYYFRAYIKTNYGIIYGEEKSFKTVEKEPEEPTVQLPTVTTNDISNITTNSAACGGNVTSDGNVRVTARGVCWSTSPNPTINNLYDEKTEDGSGTGTFTSNLINLTENTTYYVRAYATNEKGTAYGEEKSFKTVKITMPTVTTNDISNITINSAACGGNVTSDGNGTVTARGVCWSTSPNPTINNLYDEKTEDGSGTGTFTSNLINLTKNTTYYVRAYATNEAGTAYGEEKSFKTEKIVEIDVDSEGNETITLNGEVVFKMIKVDGGTFSMGATSEQGSDADSDEKPVHSVTLSDYYIGETEVTQELWEAVMGSNPSYFSGDQKPVEYVSWDDCKEFITKLNNLTGKDFRLPTEAEWEYAARGGNKSKGYKYSGSNTISDVAWYGDNSSETTHNVKTKSPNELGIYDMTGNVREWCEDWYGDYSSGSQTNPTGPSSGSSRVDRGGWNGSASNCRVSRRFGNSPGYRYNHYGFRVVCLP